MSGTFRRKPQCAKLIRRHLSAERGPHATLINGYLAFFYMEYCVLSNKFTRVATKLAAHNKQW